MVYVARVLQSFVPRERLLFASINALLSVFRYVTFRSSACAVVVVDLSHIVLPFVLALGVVAPCLIHIASVNKAEFLLQILDVYCYILIKLDYEIL